MTRHNGVRQRRYGLLETQRLIGAAIMRPLGKSDRLERTWMDGRAAAEVIAPIIKPNDRLSSLERLEIYNRQYWFRLLDCLYDDFPGMRGVLGEARFQRLSRAYLEAHPSRSFSLRNLGRFLPQFVEAHRVLSVPHTHLACDMAQFEWAQIEAFDGPSLPALDPPALARISADPARARLSLQPYLSLLELRYPLDDFLLALKKKTAPLRSEASNAVEAPAKRSRIRPVRLPRPGAVHLAVHRFENALYYKRLTAEAFAALGALRAGKPLGMALATGMAQSADLHQDWPAIIHEWFETWTRLGWLCAPVAARRRKRP